MSKSNKIYGYARVSTKAQDLNRQLDILRDNNCSEILMEKVTGKKTNRKELNKLKSIVKDGDTVVIESWSRLGRTLVDLINLVDFFSTKNVNVISIKENFNTDTPHGKLMLTVFQAFAEFERDLIVLRTKEGILSARARGRCGGRPKLKEKKVKLALDMYTSQEFSIKEIEEATSVSSSSLYRYLDQKGSVKNRDKEM